MHLNIQISYKGGSIEVTLTPSIKYLSSLQLLRENIIFSKNLWLSSFSIEFEFYSQGIACLKLSRSQLRVSSCFF